MLTRKQIELLRFIDVRLRESGVPPSFDEMKEALDLKSKSGIHRLILALEERGFIRRLPNRARALEVLRLPEATTPHNAPRGFKPSVIEGNLGKVKPRLPDAAPANDIVSIPMMGRIAAGTAPPIDRRFPVFRDRPPPLGPLRSSVSPEFQDPRRHLPVRGRVPVFLPCGRRRRRLPTFSFDISEKSLPGLVR